MIPATQIAEYVIWYSHEHGDPISNLKLQKLLYYIQGWHLALKGHAIFAEEIQAWVHGPVVPPVYRAYKAWSWQPIGVDCPTKPAITNGTEKLIQEVLQVYGSLTPIHLERLTHSESPWRDARKGLAPDAASTAVISNESMKRFFKSQLVDRKR
jgi:uncharacterized phage-associated protein